MSNNKYKILVVEDDGHIQNLLQALFESAGFKVILAGSGSSAQVMCASYIPDLIILDLGLPDQDGIVFLKKLREESAIPVIVLSARMTEDDKVAALPARYLQRHSADRHRMGHRRDPGSDAPDHQRDRQGLQACPQEGKGLISDISKSTTKAGAVKPTAPAFHSFWGFYICRLYLRRDRCRRVHQCH